MTQHASLSPERWAAFSRDQQILMIGNEMNRATRLLRLADRSGLLLAYERVLRLVDLTVEIQKDYGLRRELLRWRDLIAEMYVSPDLHPDQHLAAFRVLLQLTRNRHVRSPCCCQILTPETHSTAPAPH